MHNFRIFCQAILARQDEDVTAKVYTCLVDTQLKPSLP
jgi:hypothetical protein